MSEQLANVLTDREVMFLVRDSDPGKLGILFDRHHPALYNFFLKLTGNRAASEDLVQDVFLRMLKYKHTYRGDSQFRVWMFRIARNARHDYYRKRSREQNWDEETHEFESCEPTASESYERTQEAKLLHTALGRLPEGEREALILSRFQNVKYREIAKIFDCQEGTIKARVHRAIKHLRDEFFELSGEKSR